MSSQNVSVSTTTTTTPAVSTGREEPEEPEEEEPEEEEPEEDEPTVHPSEEKKARLSSLSTPKSLTTVGEELALLRQDMMEQKQMISNLQRKIRAMEECALSTETKRKYYMSLLFSFIDTDLSGFIDLQELSLFISKLKAREVHHSLVNKIVAQYDTDKNQALDPEEFQNFITAVLTMSFKKLDSQSSGSLSKEQCTNLVDLALGEKKEDQNSTDNLKRVDTFFEQIDEDGSGTIEVDEFIDFVVERLAKAQYKVQKNGDSFFMASAIAKLVKFNNSDIRKLAGEKSLQERLKEAQQAAAQDTLTEPKNTVKTTKSPGGTTRVVSFG